MRTPVAGQRSRGARPARQAGALGDGRLRGPARRPPAADSDGSRQNVGKAWPWAQGSRKPCQPAESGADRGSSLGGKAFLTPWNILTQDGVLTQRPGADCIRRWATRPYRGPLDQPAHAGAWSCLGRSLGRWTHIRAGGPLSGRLQVGPYLGLGLGLWPHILAIASAGGPAPP